MNIARTEGKGVLGNRFRDISLWHYLGTTPDERLFHEDAEAIPAGTLKKEYPWLDEVQLFVATGGSAVGYVPTTPDQTYCEFDRDLFVDPLNFDVKDDYDFEPLVRAARNIVRQGLKPIIKIHGVPLKLSRQVRLDWFRMNVLPPEDYGVYTAYIENLVRALVADMGLEEVKTWRWFIGTEFDNINWWRSDRDINDGEKAMEDWFVFYDWNVHALENVLGKDFAGVGSHAMMNPPGTGNAFWDAKKFLAHCHDGVNAVDGSKGSRLDFFAISYYDFSDAVLGQDPLIAQSRLGASLQLLDRKVAYTRKALDDNGFSNIKVELSEGGLCFGSDGVWLWHGLATGGIWDATWLMSSLVDMANNGLDIWSRWPYYRSSGLIKGLPVAALHAMEIAWRMHDENVISAHRGIGKLSHILTEGKDHLSLVLFAHEDSYLNERKHGTEHVTIEDIGLPEGKEVKLSFSAICEGHGDFWETWKKDRLVYKMKDSDQLYSKDQVDVIRAMNNPYHRNLFEKLSKDKYSEMAGKMDEWSETATVRNGALEFDAEVGSDRVVYIRIED